MIVRSSFPSIDDLRSAWESLEFKYSSRLSSTHALASSIVPPATTIPPLFAPPCVVYPLRRVLILGMTSISSSMQALSLDEVPASTPPQDNPAAEPHHTRAKARRSSRPGQVDPRPLPPTDEWLQVRAAKGCMYYGFYADDDMLQKMLASRYPKLRHRESNDSFLYPALLYLRNRYERNDIGLHLAVLPQRAKDLNPTIEAEVGEKVLILGLFPLEEEAYLDRMSQKEVDEIAELMGTKPTWWRISHLMPSV